MPTLDDNRESASAEIIAEHEEEMRRLEHYVLNVIAVVSFIGLSAIIGFVLAALAGFL